MRKATAELILKDPDRFAHHDATADALACARIGAALLARTSDGTTMEQLAAALDPASRPMTLT